MPIFRKMLKKLFEIYHLVTFLILTGVNNLCKKNDTVELFSMSPWHRSVKVNNDFGLAHSV